MCDFRPSAAKVMRTALFWVITQRAVVIPQTFRNILSFPPPRVKNPSSDEPTGCPETSVRNYHYTLRNSAEKRNSQALR